RAQLATEFPEISTDPNAPEFFAAWDAAKALFDEAERQADAYRDDLLSNAQANALLRERCPGFSEGSYTSAWGEGLFVTR
ncbi:MAG TPA: hypothetical protein VN605_04685, partial [Thermoanaerobaculia bacterium]|nr:hypothetical protein [Thermoanaerobaculia bacterium]